MKKIKLGFAPTRRSIFSAPAAVEYADLTRKRPYVPGYGLFVFRNQREAPPQRSN